MEDQRTAHLHVLSRVGVRSILHSEPDLGLQRQQCGRALQHARCATGPLVPRVRSPHIRRRPLRIPQKGDGKSRPNEQDPSSDPGAEHLHAASPWQRDGRRATLRLHIHTALLHPQLDLVLPDLLHVWILVSGVFDPLHHLLRDYHPALLLPPLR